MTLYHRATECQGRGRGDIGRMDENKKKKNSKEERGEALASKLQGVQTPGHRGPCLTTFSDSKDDFHGPLTQAQNHSTRDGFFSYQ